MRNPTPPHILVKPQLFPGTGKLLTRLLPRLSISHCLRTTLTQLERVVAGIKTQGNMAMAACRKSDLLYFIMLWGFLWGSQTSSTLPDISSSVSINNIHLQMHLRIPLIIRLFQIQFHYEWYDWSKVFWNCQGIKR